MIVHDRAFTFIFHRRTQREMNSVSKRMRFISKQMELKTVIYPFLLILYINFPHFQKRVDLTWYIPASDSHQVGWHVPWQRWRIVRGIRRIGWGRCWKSGRLWRWRWGGGGGGDNRTLTDGFWYNTIAGCIFRLICNEFFRWLRTMTPICRENMKRAMKTTMGIWKMMMLRIRMGMRMRRRSKLTMQSAIIHYYYFFMMMLLFIVEEMYNPLLLFYDQYYMMKCASLFIVEQMQLLPANNEVSNKITFRHDHCSNPIQWTWHRHEGRKKTETWEK